MNTSLTASSPGREERPSLSDQTPAKASYLPYFKCDKALFDCLLRSLSGVELKVALAIERHTTGHYAKADAEIAVSLLATWTGCSRNAVLTARRGLIARGIVLEVRAPTNRRAARLGLNRDLLSGGADSVPLILHPVPSGGDESAPQPPTLCTPRGNGPVPLEVHSDYPLNGLNGLEEPIELGRPLGDSQERSPSDSLAGFYEALEGAPPVLRSRLKHPDLVPGEIR